jgi:high-affinity nickel-transport protein
MPGLFSLFDDAPANARGKTMTLLAGLVLANVAAWIWAWLAFGHQPALFASAVLAYALGLRHAVDADHIAAIDNVTRKLMQENKRPVTAGFFFSLGHSSVVTLMSLAVGWAAVGLQRHVAVLRDVGSVLGTGISAFYLFLLALLNLVSLVAVMRSFASVRRGDPLQPAQLDLLQGGGALARLFRPLFRIAARSWHMFPIGLLFGLGFDTATEVALFGISAAEAGKGVSLGAIMVFPALFTAGMALLDTLDGALMLGVYGWAFTKPIRKLFYNMTVTLVSVLVAFGIAGIETLGLLRDKLDLQGPFWDGVGQANAHFGWLGYAIVVLFVAAWLLSAAFYKWRNYDAIELNFPKF